uniref:Uncharacterized protein n=1 Tax=Anguilla anguilla TaxID=7936 RepID=A0A0E9V9Q0_ANGAN
MLKSELVNAVVSTDLG